MSKTNSGQGLNKVLNKADIFALAFGAMIGWGWVVLAGEWISDAGTIGAILAFAGGGLLVLFVGLVYAELSSAMPSSQGVLLFSSRAFGKRVAFICTWSILLGFTAVIAFEAVALPTVIEYLFPSYKRVFLYSVAGYDVYATWATVGVISSFMVCSINYIGVKTAAILQTVLTIIIAIIGLTFFCGTAVTGDTAMLVPTIQNGIGGVLSVLVMTPFLYVGFDVIPQAAEEMNIPARKIGQILVFAVVMAVAWYSLIILCVGLTTSGAEREASTLITADAMANAFGGRTWAAKAIIIGGMAGIITSWNAFYIGASRALYAMANQGMLPAFLGKIHPKYHTPANAVLLLGIITSLTPLLGRNMLVWLADAGGFATIVTYLIVSLAFIRLRMREPEFPRPFAVSRWKLIGFGSIVLCSFLCILYLPFSSAALVWPYEWAIVIGWIILGLIFYISACKTRRLL